MISENIKLKLSNVSFRYNSKKEYLLRDTNFQVYNGEMVGIVGLSGSGKTTIVNILNGLIPHRIGGELLGNVFIDGEDIKKKDISELSTIVGTVFQDPDTQMFFSCVEDEIAFGLENLCIKPEEIHWRISHAVQILKIEHLLDRNPNTLSGGEKQLVIIAAIICMKVEVLILDECMSQIDSVGKALILQAIKKLKDEGTTIVMVEHDLDNLVFADRVCVISGGKVIPFNGELI